MGKPAISPPSAEAKKSAQQREAEHAARLADNRRILADRRGNGGKK